MRELDIWDVEGKTYQRFGEPGQVYFYMESEENCETCATHRRLSEAIDRPDETWPDGIPLCTFHMNVRHEARQARAFARQLAATPKLTDLLNA